MIFAEESSRPEDRRCLRFKYSSFYELNAVNTLPVHDLSAVNDYILRFKYSSTAWARVGKSMVADGILSWLSFAGIPHAAINTDWQHHTLSDRYKMHLLDATSSEDEFEQLLENLPESPTLIVDFPGNKTFWHA